MKNENRKEKENKLSPPLSSLTEMVEKILKWLMENDLYMKPEKYKWKVKRVLGSDDKTRRNKDRRRKGERCAGLAKETRS